jgi:hypothetical protein
MGLLNAIGGLVGFAIGGPAGAAIGSGIGSLASGGDLGDALKSAALGYVGGGLGAGMGAVGGQGIGALASSMGFGAAGMGSQMNPLAALFGGGGAGGGAAANPIANFARAATQGAAPAAAARGAATGAAGAGGAGITGLLNIANNPLVMATLLKATEPKNVQITTPEQQRQMDTGERLPDYRGVQSMDVRQRTAALRQRAGFAEGGYIQGPGTGTSDSIPAQIYQNGVPVQEAALSDGEFVLREKDVQALGGGDRDRGAARLYAMQRRFDNGGMA